MMSRTTGRRITEAKHIEQSVGDILGTPVGTRAERRPYGSYIADYIDAPGNPSTRLRLMSSMVMALVRWEPRIRVSISVVSVNAAGQVIAEIHGTRSSGPRAGQSITVQKALT